MIRADNSDFDTESFVMTLYQIHKMPRIKFWFWRLEPEIAPSLKQKTLTQYRLMSLLF